MSADATILVAEDGVHHGLMVAWQSIWFPLGRNSSGEVVYAPIGSEWMLAFDGTTFHATKATLKVDRRRKTVDTACGKRAKRYGIATETEMTLVPIWPSPARFAPDTTRCPECFAATGKRRPHVMFKDVA